MNNENLKIEIQIKEIAKLIENNNNNIFIDINKTINYFSFISSDFDSTENLIEFFENSDNLNKDEFIIGVGLDIENNMYILTQTRPFFNKFPKRNDLENYLYNIKDINSEYIPDIIEKLIKILNNE